MAENNLETTKQSEVTDPSIHVIEAPRYSCSLAGVYGTVLGLYDAVPLLHSGAGCGVGQLFGLLYGGGQNAGGDFGGTATPCSCLVEEHVIFGGENKLRNLVDSSIDLLNAELFVVISGCVPSLIGDDVDAVVAEFKDKAPVLHINAPGFKANSYEGYELFFEGLADQLLSEKPVKKGRVNILGVVPYQHIFWKGELKAIKDLLATIGIEANIIFTEFDTLEKLYDIPAAEYNVVLSPWNGHRAAKKLEDKFGTPFISFPGVPIGAKQTSEFLREVSKALNTYSDKVEEVIAKEERRTYRLLEYPGDAIILVRPHSYFAVAADSSTAVSVTKFLTNEIGYLPDIIQITDNPPEEFREAIIKEITENLETGFSPDIIFEVDSFKIRENFKDRPFLFLFGSSLEAPTAMSDFGALSVTISFPSYNRMVLVDNYVGYDGGTRLVEHVVSTFAGPL